MAPSPPVTSGTVLGYSFNVGKVIDHALRKAGYQPEETGSEWLEVAQDLLFTQLSTYVNAGSPLWTKRFVLLGTTIGSPDVVCPYGTVDTLHVYWRILQPYRGAALTSDGQDATGLFSGAPTADITIATPNPSVSVSFGSPTEVDTIGIIVGGSTVLADVSLLVQASQDGVTWTAGQALPVATYTPNQWTYFDLNPTITAPFLRVVYPTITAAWTLQQINFGLANGTDIQIGPLNVDDYYNLPNKDFQAPQANSAWTWRNLNQPTIKIWPTVNSTGFYNGTIAALTRRYIQDPGLLTDSLEIPARWLDGVIARLGTSLMDSLPQPKADAAAGAWAFQGRSQRRQNLEQVATKFEALLWSEERDNAPMRWAPNIRGYTV